jgi:hypothetical protein
MTVDRLRHIVNLVVPTLFAQIYGGRVQCESEATLQLHLGRVITTVADLAITSPRETKQTWATIVNSSQRRSVRMTVHLVETNPVEFARLRELQRML